MGSAAAEKLRSSITCGLLFVRQWTLTSATGGREGSVNTRVCAGSDAPACSVKQSVKRRMGDRMGVSALKIGNIPEHVTNFSSN